MEQNYVTATLCVWFERSVFFERINARSPGRRRGVVVSGVRHERKLTHVGPG